MSGDVALLDHRLIALKPTPRVSRHKRGKTNRGFNYDLDGFLDAVSIAWNALIRTTLRKRGGYAWIFNLLT